MPTSYLLWAADDLALNSSLPECTATLHHINFVILSNVSKHYKAIREKNKLTRNAGYIANIKYKGKCTGEFWSRPIIAWGGLKFVHENFSSFASKVFHFKLRNFYI